MHMHVRSQTTKYNWWVGAQHYPQNLHFVGGLYVTYVSYFCILIIFSMYACCTEVYIWHYMWWMYMQLCIYMSITSLGTFTFSLTLKSSDTKVLVSKSPVCTQMDCMQILQLFIKVPQSIFLSWNVSLPTRTYSMKAGESVTNTIRECVICMLRRQVTQCWLHL